MEIWPDNIQSVNVFVAMSTQWRSGMAGATGLDYGVLPAVLRLTAVPRAAWSEVFESLRVMEDAALEVMRRKRG